MHRKCYNKNNKNLVHQNNNAKMFKTPNFNNKQQPFVIWNE